jgi:hypothetical protein
VTVADSVALEWEPLSQSDLFGYSVPVRVKVPPTAPAVTKKLLKVAVVPETATHPSRSPSASDGFAPLGSEVALNFTYELEFAPVNSIGLYEVCPPGSTGLVVCVGTVNGVAAAATSSKANGVASIPSSKVERRIRGKRFIGRHLSLIGPPLGELREWEH